MTWILTSTGRRVDFADPQPDTIDIIDIANGLSKQCRFSGQCRAHYSVAQHCVLVSALVPPQAAMAALLHDAAEAYMHDIPSPLKQMLPEYQVIERRLLGAIHAHFGVRPTEADQAAIAHADLVMLAKEFRELMPHDDEPWKILDVIEPRIKRVFPWDHNRGFQEFLERFDSLRTRRR